MAVDVWRVDLECPPEGVRPDADGAARAARLRGEVVRSRFLASRVWLRVVLAGYLDIDPADVRFAAGERGKPSVAGGGDVHFSLSRSAAVALVAVTRGRPVGVDAEVVRHDLDPLAIAGRFFAPAEVESLRQLPSGDRVDAFLRLWVRKEAVVKATGTGLGDGLRHLDVRGASAGGCCVASLDVGPGLAAAVAVHGEVGSILLRTPALTGIP